MKKAVLIFAVMSFILALACVSCSNGADGGGSNPAATTPSSGGENQDGTGGKKNNFVWLMTKMKGDNYEYKYKILWVQDTKHYEVKQQYRSETRYDLYYDDYNFSATLSSSGNSYHATRNVFSDKNIALTEKEYSISKIGTKMSYQKVSNTIESGNFDLANNLGNYNYHETHNIKTWGISNSNSSYESYYLINDGKIYAYYYDTSKNNWYYIWDYVNYDGLEFKNQKSSDNGKSYTLIYKPIEILDNKMVFQYETKQKISGSQYSNTTIVVEYEKFEFGYDSGEKYMSYNLSESDFAIFEE